MSTIAVLTYHKIDLIKDMPALLFGGGGGGGGGTC